MTAEIKFVDVFPSVSNVQCMYMLEAMTYKAVIKMEPCLANDPHQIIVEVWCNQYDKDNPSGNWHAIRLPYIASEDNANHTYATSIIITSASDFEYTFRMKHDSNKDWLWSHGYNQNGRVHVELPRQADKWTQGPNFDEIIYNSIWVGNFIAASNAKSCGFTHVLNCADNLDIVYAGGGIDYKKIPLKDGAANPISDESIKEAVLWLKERNKKGNRILINCRAGIGRAGSIAVAFVFATNSSMSFDDAYKFVFQKRFIYTHTGLKESLYNLYPRYNM